MPGGALVKTSLVDPFERAELTIGDYAWRLRSGVREKAAVVEGNTDDLDGVRVIVMGEVNGAPVQAVELVEGVRKHPFASGLDPVEHEWLVGVINDHLEDRRERVGDVSVFIKPDSGLDSW